MDKLVTTDDRITWLAEQGYILAYDDDPDGSLLGVIWTTRAASLRFRATGRTKDEMWDTLFSMVKQSLWMRT